MSLGAATRSEFTKQFSTSIWWILAIVLVAYVGFMSSVLAGAFGANASGALPSNGPDIPAALLPPLIYSTGTAVGYVFPLLIGTLLVTSEFRHKTLTPTFLATPRRGTVLVAKSLAGAVLGLLYGALAIVAAVGPGAGLLAVFGLDTALDSADTWAMLGRMLLASVLWVLIGIGVGATVRNQIATIVIVLAFTQFIEPIGRTVGMFVDGLSEVVRFLPGGAADALVGASIYTAMSGSTDPNALEWWAGGLVLLGYAVVFLVIGRVTNWRRDVD